MKINFDIVQVDVKRGQLLKLADARGARVSCQSGVLWLTQDGDRDDVVLLAGQSLVLEKDGLTLIHACRESALRVDVAPQAQPAATLGCRSTVPVLRTGQRTGASVLACSPA